MEYQKFVLQVYLPNLTFIATKACKLHLANCKSAAQMSSKIYDLGAHQKAAKLMHHDVDAIMVLLSAGMDASVGAPGYERHRPKRTLLYQLVQKYYPAYGAQLAAEGKE